MIGEYLLVAGLVEHLQRCSLCDPSKMFSRPSLVIYSFATPITLKLGQQMGGRLLIGNHLEQSLWRANQKLWWSSVRSLFITLFYAGAQHCCVFHQPPRYVQLRWTKTIFLSQTVIFWLFFHPILLCKITYWASLEMHHGHSFRLVATVLQPISGDALLP
jgi:hypothetical protein